MKSNLLTLTLARPALILTLATAVSMPVLADDQNSAILPPSMRPKVQASEEASVSPKEADNYRLYEEWKKSKGQRNVEYEEFLLWQDFIKTKQKG